MTKDPQTNIIGSVILCLGCGAFAWMGSINFMATGLFIAVVLIIYVSVQIGKILDRKEKKTASRAGL